MSEAAQVRAALADAADPAYAVQARRFFKTGPGEYGAGDVFLGVRVPATRAIVRRFADLPFGEIEILLDSEIHEERLAGLLILAALAGLGALTFAGRSVLGRARKGSVS